MCLCVCAYILSLYIFRYIHIYIYYPYSRNTWCIWVSPPAHPPILFICPPNSISPPHCQSNPLKTLNFFPPFCRFCLFSLRWSVRATTHTMAWKLKLRSVSENTYAVIIIDEHKNNTNCRLALSRRRAQTDVWRTVQVYNIIIWPHTTII